MASILSKSSQQFLYQSHVCGILYGSLLKTSTGWVSPTHPSCGPPARFSSFKKHNTLSLGPLILSQVSSGRCTSYATSDNDDIGFSGKLFCSTVSDQELVGLAVPEGVAGLGGGECGAFVLHVAMSAVA